jgi:hypothetical protein
MADDKYSAKADTKADTKADPEPKPAAKGSLGPAGEASDPAVHAALAKLQIAQSNRAALDVNPADVQAADDEVKAAEKALADLGYQAP